MNIKMFLFLPFFIVSSNVVASEQLISYCQRQKEEAKKECYSVASTQEEVTKMFCAGDEGVIRGVIRSELFSYFVVHFEGGRGRYTTRDSFNVVVKEVPRWYAHAQNIIPGVLDQELQKFKKEVEPRL